MFPFFSDTLPGQGWEVLQDAWEPLKLHLQLPGAAGVCLKHSER